MRPHTIVTTIAALALSAVGLPQPQRKLDGVAIPLTRRSSLTNPDGCIDFEALTSHIAFINAKILQGLDDHKESRGIPHNTALKGRAPPQPAAAIGLETDVVTKYQSHYFSPISIGTSPVTLTVLFDTGSGDFIVPSSECGATCDGHTRWNPTQSTTAKRLPQQLQTEYADNSVVTADQYTDNVTFAGFTADTQTIGAALTYPERLKHPAFPPDGVLGMGFPSLAKMQGTPFFTTLMNEEKLPKPVFSFRATRTAGELYIGGWNPAYNDEDFTYISVTKRGYWQVELQSITDIYKRTLMHGADAIIDSGSATILGDPSQVEQIHYWLNGKFYRTSTGMDFYTFPCQFLPSLSLTFGDKLFGVSADTLNMGPLSEDPSRCLSGIVGNKLSRVPYWVVGNAFLQNVYTTFDVGQARVGFADIKP